MECYRLLTLRVFSSNSVSRSHSVTRLIVLKQNKPAAQAANLPSVILPLKFCASSLKSWCQLYTSCYVRNCNQKPRTGPQFINKLFKSFTLELPRMCHVEAVKHTSLENVRFERLFEVPNFACYPLHYILVVQNTFYLTYQNPKLTLYNEICCMYSYYLFKTQNQFRLNRVCDKHSQGRGRILALYYYPCQ